LARLPGSVFSLQDREPRALGLLERYGLLLAYPRAMSGRVRSRCDQSIYIHSFRLNQR